jgi:peptidase C39-like protein
MFKQAMLAAIVCLVGLTQSFSPSSLVGRLRAWESRFDSVQITYRTNRGAGLWTLCTTPASEALTSSNRIVESYEGGVFYRLIPKKSGDVIGMSYGSYGGRPLTAMLADSRSILFALGVLLAGDTKMSSAVKGSANVQCDALSGSFVQFGWALGERDAGTVRIEWTRQDEVPSKVTLSTPTWSLVRAFYPAANIWPVRIHEFKVFGDGKSTDGRWLTVEEPKPAPSHTKSLRPTPGSKVMDENFNITYVEGDQLTFDKSLAATALSYALAGKPLVQRTGRQLLCGLDCLYYMGKLLNHNVDNVRLENLLPEAKRRGSNFAELKAAASAVGIRLQGYHLSIDALRQGGKMAILSLRNSHFALLVPHGSNSTALIDPPYSVRLPSDLDYQLVWTGDALVYTP